MSGLEDSVHTLRATEHSTLFTICLLGFAPQRSKSLWLFFETLLALIIENETFKAFKSSCRDLLLKSRESKRVVAHSELLLLFLELYFGFI